MREAVTSANEAMHRFVFAVESEVIDSAKNRGKSLDQLIAESPE